MQLNVEVVIGILLITLFLFSFLLYLFLRASFDCQSHCKAMQNQTNNFNQILDFSIDFLSVGNRLDQQPKILEGGQPRWSPDSSMYIAYLRDLQDKRREDLLLSMHVKCSERWFLSQLMKKYAGIALICSSANSRR